MAHTDPVRHCSVGFLIGRRRALKSAGGDRRKLHSLPVYYGANVAMWAIVPAATVLIIWMLAQPFFVNSRVLDTLPDAMVSEGSSIGLVMSDVRRVADGLDVAVQQGAMSRDEAASISTKHLMCVSAWERWAWPLAPVSARTC